MGIVNSFSVEKMLISFICLCLLFSFLLLFFVVVLISVFVFFSFCFIVCIRLCTHNILNPSFIPRTVGLKYYHLFQKIPEKVLAMTSLLLMTNFERETHLTWKTKSRLDDLLWCSKFQLKYTILSHEIVFVFLLYFLFIPAYIMQHTTF